MAERTVERGERLEFLLSSGAKRAVSTAHEFHRVFPDAELHTENAIYEARVSDLLQVVNKLPNDKGVVALFGHNPGFSQLVDYLCDYAMHLPTAGLVKINFELDSWELVSESTGEIEYIDYPKNGNT